LHSYRYSTGMIWVALNTPSAMNRRGISHCLCVMETQTYTSKTKVLHTCYTSNDLTLSQNKKYFHRVCKNSHSNEKPQSYNKCNIITANILVDSVQCWKGVNSDNVCFQTVALPAVGGCVGKGSLGDGIPPAGSRGRAPGGGLGGTKRSPQKLKQYTNLKGTKPSYICTFYAFW